MADVVRLKEHLTRLPRRESVWRERPADVVLFTGVRYERLTPGMIACKPHAGMPGNGPDSARRP